MVIASVAMAREPLRVDSELLVIDRLRTRLTKLEETCMSRYEEREEHVLSVLSYCVNALEQLQGWASFAIFPPDESNSESYIAFVDMRFQCVIKPLRLFLQAVQKEQHLRNQQALQHVKDAPEHGSSVHDNSSDVTFAALVGQSDEFQRRFSANPQVVKSPRSPQTSPHGSHVTNHDVTEGDNQDIRDSPLKIKVDRITQKHIEEAYFVKGLVLSKINKLRKDIRVVYRWGQGSLIDLNGVMDDALGEEIYLMVRGKMARVLSVISIYHETAELVEKSLTQQNDQQSEKSDRGTSDVDSGVSSTSPGSSGAMPLKSQDESSFNTMDLQGMKLCLGDLSESGSGYTLRGDPEDTQNIDTDSNAGSTPEPPCSPRPKGLFKHPRIMKDRLQNYALPSRFPRSLQAHALNSSW